MNEPKRSRPYWPDALQNATSDTSGLKSWDWAVQRLEQSHNYWLATSRADGRPHLMLVWGLWWQDAFWFSTGLRTRKARNIFSNPRCVVATDKADEAVILEGAAKEVSDRAVWKELIPIYNRKYGGDIGPLLEGSGSTIFRVTPEVVFAQDEHAENFTDAVTRWTFA